MAGGGARPAGMAPAPDGGYGWVICFAGFMLQMLTIGITYTFGVKLRQLMEEFDATEDVVTWVGSIQPALLYLTGIFAGPLIARLGWRRVCIASAIFSSSGFLISSWAPDIYTLYFTYGVMTGIGNGAMYLVSMTSVQFYFEQKRAMATGIAVSGSGVGCLFFGTVSSYLISSYGWRTTFRIEAAIMLTGAFFGFLIKPLPFEQSDEMEIDNSNPISINDDDDDDENQRCGACRTCGNIFGEIFDFSLFKNPVYITFGITLLCFCFGYHVPFTYTPDIARSKLDLNLFWASFLVSVIGIANVVSRLLFGFIADRSETVRYFLGGTTLFIGGFASSMVGFCDSYELYVVYCCVFGCCSGCWASLFPVILVDLLGLDKIEKALSQCLAIGSIAFLIASPLSGMLLLKTGLNYLPFVVVGILQMLGSLAFFSIKFINRFRDRYIDYEDEDADYLINEDRPRFYSQSFS